MQKKFYLSKQNWFRIIILIIMVSVMVSAIIILWRANNNISQIAKGRYPCKMACVYNVNESKWHFAAVNINRRFSTEVECLKFCAMWNRIKR